MGWLIAAVFVLCLIGLLALRRGKDLKQYDPRLAWLRGGVYFSACMLIARASGAWQAVFNQPLASAANRSDPGWILFSAGCAAILYVGYFLVWPRGTLSHGRRLDIPAVLIFGSLWGLSESLLFVAVWFAAANLIEPTWLVAVVAFIIISAFSGLWHQLYWDIYVAPEHNILEWNGRKVLFAHVPNLLVTLTYLAIYESFGMFVLFQTIVLLASTYFMRFPGFWSPASAVAEPV